MFDYESAEDTIREICSKYSFEEQKKCNKEIKQALGGRLCGVRGGQTEATYMVICETEDETYVANITWDFWNKNLGHDWT